MNIALIIAGGSGARMHQDIPKQFINVADKPVIIYTLEAFQSHPNIDEIYVVCIDGWHDILRAYAKQFNITKLTSIISGGKTGQESIRNGVLEIAKTHSDEDIVLIHDAIRPMISHDIISDNICVCSEHGNAITVIPCAEAMLITNDGESSKEQENRDHLKRTQTPQAMKLGKLVKLHKDAIEKGITSSVATCTLLIEMGETVYFSSGSEKNIKLTTPDDIDIFKALLKSKRSEWMK
ncbi:MAG: 2-C-methyl-D-erythritol 4-phosphate cytidylyltransferase [Bacilli bacterium]|nr:2-C-methyl-D-erythritol 4-phosphate cytidylyltransferase [Bacilli bacterium]